MDRPVFPFFVGSGRSGTTLFGIIFDAHPDLAVAHEAHFVADLAVRRPQLLSAFDADSYLAGLEANSNFQRLEVPSAAVRSAVSGVTTYSDAVRATFSVLAGQRGKRLYGDKTPGYLVHIPMLARLFAEARFVHIVRDGRDVALAYVERPEWGPTTIGAAAWNWRSRLTRARRAGRALGPGRYVEVRYEALVSDPEPTVREVCAFLGISFHPEMLDHTGRGRELSRRAGTPEAFTSLSRPITPGLRDWRSQMSPAEVGLFEAVAGDLLTELGYEVTGAGRRLRPRLAGGAAWTGWQARRLGARLKRGRG